MRLVLLAFGYLAITSGVIARAQDLPDEVKRVVGEVRDPVVRSVDGIGPLNAADSLRTAVDSATSPPTSPAETDPAGPSNGDAPDEFDVRVLDHRIEKSEAVVLRLWEAAIESRSAGGPADIVRDMEEKATRLTLELKGLRRQRDELRLRVSGVPDGEFVPLTTPTSGGDTGFRPALPPNDGFAPYGRPDPRRSSGRRGPPPASPAEASPDTRTAEERLAHQEEELQRLRQQNEVLKQLVRKRMTSESQGRGEFSETPIEQLTPTE